MTDEDLKAAKALVECSSMVDWQARAPHLVPKLIAEVERLRELRNPLRVLSASEIQDALHQGRAEAMASQGDNAWSSLLRQRDEARAEVERLRVENEALRERYVHAVTRWDR